METIWSPTRTWEMRGGARAGARARANAGARASPNHPIAYTHPRVVAEGVRIHRRYDHGAAVGPELAPGRCGRDRSGQVRVGYVGRGFPVGVVGEVWVRCVGGVG
eukprot:scaffold114460_cov42-Phaeocystis_antarctica.AAC.1